MDTRHAVYQNAIHVNEIFNGAVIRDTDEKQTN